MNRWRIDIIHNRSSNPGRIHAQLYSSGCNNRRSAVRCLVSYPIFIFVKINIVYGSVIHVFSCRRAGGNCFRDKISEIFLKRQEVLYTQYIHRVAQKVSQYHMIKKSYYIVSKPVNKIRFIHQPKVWIKYYNIIVWD